MVAVAVVVGVVGGGVVGGSVVRGGVVGGGVIILRLRGGSWRGSIKFLIQCSHASTTAYYTTGSTYYYYYTAMPDVT